MWWVFHANTPETQTPFQSGWFVVGHCQTLIVHMIRTRRAVQSCASWPLMIMTVIGMIVGTHCRHRWPVICNQALPLSYFRGWLRFWQGI